MNCNINKINDLFKSEGSQFDVIRTSLKEKGNLPKKKPGQYITNYVHTDNEYLYNTMLKKKKTDAEQ